MRQYFYTAVEQLDLAAQQLQTQEPSTARLALILSDNIVELMLHQQCSDAVWRDRLYRHLNKMPLTPKRRTEIVGRYFGPKLGFCYRELGRFGSDVYETIRVAHDLRNELYHVGRRHEDIVYEVAWHYHDAACNLLGELPLEVYSWNTDDKLSDVVVRHATKSPWELKTPFEDAAASLAASKPTQAPQLAAALANSLMLRLEIVENHFGWIMRGDESDAIAEAEFDDFAYGDDSPVWDKVRDLAEDERERALKRIRAKWQPRFTANPLPRWRRQCERLSTQRKRGSALATFHRLEAEIEPFERFIIKAANGVIDAIEMQIDIMRGK